ncbi:MAG: sensor histidine kinase [Candidatus Sulfotelmatobacter sp.]
MTTGRESRFVPVCVLALAGTLVLFGATARMARLAPSSDFMPHGYCYLWNPLVLWLNVISDSLIVISYYCIPLALVYLVRKRSDLPFNWIFWMFGLFIMGCGTTHLMEVWTVWHASYLLAGVIKAITASVSVLTAIMLVPLIPKAIALPSPAHLFRVNQELETQIAGRKQIELELRQILAERDQTVRELAERKEQLEKANGEMLSFTYTISHDLRAPLRHIGAFSNMLEEEFQSDLPAEAQRYLQRIRQGAKNMGTLVDDLLGYTRIGRQPLKLQATSLRATVDDIVARFKPEIQQREVEWRIHSLSSIQCDADLIHVVFENLISNALKFTRDRRPAVIEIGGMTANGEIVFYVRDNGVGFSMKYVSKIFGVFHRLHRTEEFEGTGIGLAIAHRIIEKHGGRIWTEAEVDRGATFYFTLGGLRSWSEGKEIAYSHQEQR